MISSLATTIAEFLAATSEEISESILLSKLVTPEFKPVISKSIPPIWPSTVKTLVSVDALFDAKLISNYADLYDLTFHQVVELERMADKSANNLIFGKALG